MRSLYVHIPFCLGACDYCDFLSFPLENSHSLPRYLEALCREMSFYSGEAFQTLYLGGGTPSILRVEQIARLEQTLQRCFNLERMNEFTLEANPETVDVGRVRAWTRAGVNRVSLGVQSFDERVLAAHQRTASVEDARRAFQLLRSGGVANIGLDLILGLQCCQAVPDEETAVLIFKDDLREAVALDPEHISVYLLSMSEGSRSTGQQPGIGEVMFTDRTVEKLFLHTVRFLGDHGFKQYEVSNFAKAGFESEHNKQYWRGGEYRGLGLGAVSTIGNRRLKNVEVLQEYMDTIAAGKRPVGEVEILHSPVRTIERVMLALRQGTGIACTELLRGTPHSARRRLLAYLSSLRELDLAEQEAERIALTPRGQLRSNVIIADIVRLMEIQ
jgi:oxygen-independent coproporphyrinogen-3 oxidase